MNEYFISFELSYDDLILIRLFSRNSICLMTIKGQSNDQASYSISEEFFFFGFKFKKIFAILDWLSTIVYSRELILPSMFRYFN